MSSRVAMAAALVMLLAACSPQANAPTSTPGPDVRPSVESPTPTPRPSRPPVAAMPSAIWGDWHAPDVAIPGLTGPQLARLSLSWEDGKHGWIQLDGEGNGRQVLQFVSLAAADGEILVSSDGGAGCGSGQEGRYSWNRSLDGLFLTLRPIEDSCETRAAAFARSWVHSLSAVNDGGLGMIPGDPWLQVVMPKQRLAMSGGTDAADLHTFDDSQPFRSLIVIKDPMGLHAPCEEARQPFAIDPTTTAFEAYLKTMPGLEVSSTATTIDGVAGRKIRAVSNSATKCPVGEIGLFRSRVPNEAHAEWSMSPGHVLFLWAMVRGGHLYVISYDGDGVTQSDGQAVIDTLKFMAALPTP